MGTKANCLVCVSKSISLCTSFLYESRAARAGAEGAHECTSSLHGEEMMGTHVRYLSHRHAQPIKQA